MLLNHDESLLFEGDDFSDLRIDLYGLASCANWQLPVEVYVPCEFIRALSSPVLRCLLAVPAKDSSSILLGANEVFLPCSCNG